MEGRVKLNKLELFTLKVACPLPEETLEMKRIVTLASPLVMPGREENVVMVRGVAPLKSSPNNSLPDWVSETNSCSCNRCSSKVVKRTVAPSTVGCVVISAVSVASVRK